MRETRKMSRAQVVAIAAAALLVLGGCGGDEATTDVAEEVAVLGARDVATVQRAEINSTVVLTGSLNPYRIVDVRAQVPGTITGIQVDEGDAVRPVSYTHLTLPTI